MNIFVKGTTVGMSNLPVINQVCEIISFKPISQILLLVCWTLVMLLCFHWYLWSNIVMGQWKR